MTACTAHLVNEPPPTPVALNIAESRGLYIYSLARLRILDGDLDGALTLLRAAIEADPNSAFLQLTMANLLVKMNKPDEALEACEKSLKLDPNNADAHLFAGNLLMGMKKDQEAIAHYKKAKELDPTKEQAYLHLAITYVRGFEYEEAVNTLKDLIKVIRTPILAIITSGRPMTR